MIIEVTQISSNVKQEYEITGPEFGYFGRLGGMSKMQQIQMSSRSTSYTASFSPCKWTNYIPLRYLFGIPNLSKCYNIKCDDKDIGHFLCSKQGFMKSFYLIELEDDTVLHCYARMIDSFNYISIYCENEQIALIETYLCCNDLKYKHKIYLLDEYDRLGEILALFTLYYANYNFTRRMHMSSGANYQKGYSLSKYNDKYNPEWREKHFPDENFFGKTSLF